MLNSGFENFPTFLSSSPSPQGAACKQTYLNFSPLLTESNFPPGRPTHHLSNIYFSFPRLLGCGPWGLLDNFLHALRALRPCDPRNSLFKINFFISDFFRSFWRQRIYDTTLGVRDPLHTRFLWRAGRATGRGIGYSSSWIFRSHWKLLC